jgi:hypothetical protein
MKQGAVPSTGKKTFLFSKVSRQATAPTQPLYLESTMDNEAIYKAYHSLLSSGWLQLFIA